jgi:LDH2 family malate/lactate/ureidoglycolate dehydrogenase
VDDSHVTQEQALSRLAALGFSSADADILASHFLAAERAGRTGHGLVRIDWLETWTGLAPAARPRRVVAEHGYERWDGNGAHGYLVVDAIVEAQLDDPPDNARIVVAAATFPTGVLGYWTRRLAERGLVAAMTATSPPRLRAPGGGPPLAGTNPLSIAIPSSDGHPIVADASMGNLNFGDVLAGRASEDELAPFGGAHAHKAFALAIGLQLLVDALTPDEGFGAVLVVAHPLGDPVPGLRALADGVRLPGDPRPG